VRMISMIHDTTIVNKGRKERKTNMEVKKPYAVVQYNKFMKGVDRADQYLSLYSVLRKAVKWSKKVVLYLLNCALFNAFSVYRTLNTTKKVKYKNQGGLNRTRQADSLVISEYTNLKKKLLVVGREKGSIPQDCVKCVLLHIRSEVKLDTFVNFALFRFTKGLLLRNTIQ